MRWNPLTGVAARNNLMGLEPFAEVEKDQKRTLLYLRQRLTENDSHLVEVMGLEPKYNNVQMKTGNMLEINSSSQEGTQRIARILAHNLTGGEVIELEGDLGAGKTAFVRGLAAGIESSDVVQSPSFTITRIYKGKNGLDIHHFDFHRLEEPGVVAEELVEVAQNPKAVVAIEWSNIVEKVLPIGRLQVKITTGNTVDERVFIFNATDSKHQKLLEGIS